VAKRELLVRLVSSERQRLLRKAGKWVAQNAKWAITSRDDNPWMGWPAKSMAAGDRSWHDEAEV
jgi:hypothetical protein